MTEKEELEFKEMIKDLRKKNNKPTLYEVNLLSIIKELETELEKVQKENKVLNKVALDNLKSKIDLETNFERFVKKEAVGFMKMFKEMSDYVDITEEMQCWVNRFIYKLTHSVFLCNQ